MLSLVPFWSMTNLGFPYVIGTPPLNSPAGPAVIGIPSLNQEISIPAGDFGAQSRRNGRREGTVKEFIGGDLIENSGGAAKEVKRKGNKRRNE